MGRFIIIILGLVGLGGAYLWMQRTQEEARAQTEQALSSARRTFADQARSAVADETEAYLTNIKAALEAYEEELDRVYEARPEWRDPEAYRREVETLFQDGELKEGQKKSMLEGYAIVKDAYDTLMARNWQPVLTADGPGHVRVDIYRVERTRDREGNPMLEGKAFFWGVEDNSRVGWDTLALRYWVKRSKTRGRGRARGDKAVDEVLGRVEGESTPRIIIQKPAAYIPQFPSYVSVGRIWFPVMPREAHAVDIAYGFSVRKGGGSHDIALRWPRWPIPASWQLREGELWEADVVEATEAEIAGADP